jgi:small-conductance mechanosensitive channel
MLARAVPGLVGGFLVIETARYAGFITDGGDAIAQAAWVALVAYLVVDGFAGGFFKPISPAWRIANVDFAKARPAATLLLAIVFVVGAKSVLVAMAATLPEHAALQRAASGVAAVIVAALMFFLCEDRSWGRTEAPTPIRASGARFLGRALAILILAAAISGHVAHSDFVATRLYYLALVLAVAWFARAALREAAASAERRLKSGREGDSTAGDSAAYMFWVGASVDIVILLLTTPALLLIAGLDFAAARDIFGKALIGFRVGDIVISFSDIFFAVIAFIGVLAATRALQGGLQRGPLSHPRLDPGVRQSFVTLFGYVGLVVAALVGVSVLGVDLSNLAIIAGALSVGVGFGLQSIINNFVSGIILLFERPIKTGDWIVTASGEGIVRRIGVRSTEIETFDRSSIIIPNSELVASTVTNWTHGGALGRIKVPVGVAYSSDPDRVRDILLACARANPHILQHPEPFVVWQDFGASSLDFELRAFVRNITDGIHVRTELRFAIFKAFREAGIEIPFPQQDIHIRSASEAVQRVAALGRSREGGRAPPHEPDEIDGPED